MALGSGDGGRAVLAESGRASVPEADRCRSSARRHSASSEAPAAQARTIAAGGSTAQRHDENRGEDVMNASDTILYCGLFATRLVAALKQNRLRKRSNSQATANVSKTQGESWSLINRPDLIGVAIGTLSLKEE